MPLPSARCVRERMWAPPDDGFAPVEAPAADKKATPANTAGSAVSPAKQGVTTVQPTQKANGK